MLVRDWQTCVRAVGVGDCALSGGGGGWLSDFLGSISPRVGYAFWDIGSGGDARAYIDADLITQHRQGFFGVKSQAFLTRLRSSPAGEKVAISGPRGVWISALNTLAPSSSRVVPLSMERKWPFTQFQP